MAKKILAVDDSQTMREMVSFTLSEVGYEVIEAEDGKAALNVLKQVKVDAVITDLNMPNMNGFELIRELRANPAFKYTPILMLTTEGNEQKKNEGRAAGASGWIIKPFDPEKLVEVLRKVCPIPVKGA